MNNEIINLKINDQGKQSNLNSTYLANSYIYS